MTENKYCYVLDKRNRKIYYDKEAKTRIAKKNIDKDLLDKIVECDKSEVENFSSGRKTKPKTEKSYKYTDESELYYKVNKADKKMFYDASTNKRVNKSLIEPSILDKIQEKDNE